MKKIGIVTIWSNNYGSVLQAFALQTIIERLGYQVEIIQHYRDPLKKETQSRIKQILQSSPSFLIEYAMNYKRNRMLHQGYADFKSSRLKISREAYYQDSDFTDLASRYDAIVVGSDMLWSYDFKDNWPFYFASFAPSEKIVTYAPSFGKNDLSKEEIELCKPMISRIVHLSCREEAGVSFIKEQFGLAAEHVIDPTLLLSGEEWSHLLGDMPRLVKKDYILTYVFRGSCQNGREELFEQFNSMKDKQLLFINGQEGEFKNNIYNGYFSPAEYVNLFRDADFIVTDTFHGLMFSLIFNKPFIVLDKSSFGVSSDRQQSTLKTYGLEDRFVTPDIIVSDELRQLDYTTIEQKINANRKKSINYLKKALEDATK